MDGKNRAARGFTLLEMIMVVSIILLLLGTLVVFVANAHLESQKQATRKIIDGIESALVTYYDEWGQYPPEGQLTSHGSAPNQVSAALCLALTGSGTKDAVSSMASLPGGAVATDPNIVTSNPDSTGQYFVDAWHNPIVCTVYALGSNSAEANGGMPFIYSYGPDGQATWGNSPNLQSLSFGGVDTDNITNFRDLPIGQAWGYTP
jgi:prepilin-type N-terminal cleavage/methylation domain-containing protein